VGWQYTPYTLLLLAVAAVCAGLAGYTGRREAPGARTVALMMLAVFSWSLGYAFELAAEGLAGKVFWAKVEYLGIVTVPAAWLAFALRYTGRERWVTRGSLGLLAAIPVVTLALVWTNAGHGLIWRRTALDSSGVFMEVSYGPWFWVFWVYSYALLLLGTYFLVSMLLRSPRLYREQAWALLIGAFAPWVGNSVYVLGLNPVPHLDLTPFAFLASGAALSWGMLRYHFLEIVPVARDAVIEGMNDGVIVTDTRGRIVDLNPAARRILQLPETNGVGGFLAEVAPDVGTLLEGYQGAEEAHKEVALEEGTERRDYDLLLTALRDRKGRLTGRLLVLRDVTERRRAERELIRQRADLARSNAELEHFAYLIAHDLRAPLRGINGFSHILMEDYAERLDEQGRDYLRRVREATGHMGQMIDELLDLSRITRATLRRETVDLSDLAKGIAGEVRAGNPDRRGEFVIAGGLVAEGDRRLLRVALANLLDNAWKYTRRNPEARIEFGAERREGEVAYFVRDNGVGFDMAYAGKLFGAFQRLHAADEFEGTGIGLAAVERVIERHGGQVWAEGEVGRGATFYFTL